MATTRVLASLFIVVVAIAIHSSLAAISCYDCSDSLTGCLSCQQQGNCSCSPCWMNTSTPVCTDPTTCYRQVLVQPNAFGVDIKMITASCGINQQSSPQSGSQPVTTSTGCYSSTYTISGPPSYSYSMAMCYCNTDKCNTACSCGVEAPVTTVAPSTTSTTKPVIPCSNGGHIFGNSVAVVMLSAVSVIIVRAL